MNERTRRKVLAIAQRWHGTPYCHAASRRQAGCDCLGLVRGIWRELYGDEPELPPAYAANWAEAGRETLLCAARRHLGEITVETARPGDVLLFRWRRTAPAGHAAILFPAGQIMHAYEGRAVVCTALSPWWRKRIAAAFAFPSLSEHPEAA